MIWRSTWMGTVSLPFLLWDIFGIGLYYWMAQRNKTRQDKRSHQEQVNQARAGKWNLKDGVLSHEHVKEPKYPGKLIASDIVSFTLFRHVFLPVLLAMILSIPTFVVGAAFGFARGIFRAATRKHIPEKEILSAKQCADQLIKARLPFYSEAQKKTLIKHILAEYKPGRTSSASSRGLIERLQSEEVSLDDKCHALHLYLNEPARQKNKVHAALFSGGGSLHDQASKIYAKYQPGAEDGFNFEYDPTIHAYFDNHEKKLFSVIVSNLNQIQSVESAQLRAYGRLFGMAARNGRSGEKDDPNSDQSLAKLPKDVHLLILRHIENAEEYRMVPKAERRNLLETTYDTTRNRPGLKHPF